MQRARMRHSATAKAVTARQSARLRPGAVGDGFMNIPDGVDDEAFRSTRTGIGPPADEGR